ncbi:MAG: cytochrome c-type biogenesis protein CcmH [Deltaproteobacteria bacterium]|nr:cytochrome c-type biogenesis protein CcmH [Deltaproteobacteria bacterium]
MNKEVSLIFFLLLTVYCLLPASSSYALTVQEVATDLACPCECPLVLEDCNMSCGLDWKDQIGQMISQGKTKEEIIKYFIDKYGDAARITPVQRIKGKFFKYTRAFDTMDWTIFWTVIGIWLIGVFIGVYILTRRLLSKKVAR